MFRQACFAAIAVMGALGSPARADGPSDEWRQVDVVSPKRPSRASARKADCAFAGTLNAWSMHIYTTEAAANPSVIAGRLDVSRLAPARKRDGRLAISSDWPIVVDGWIVADDAPFQLRTRVDVVKGHLWLAPGARVSAYGAENGSVHVVRAGSSALDRRRPRPDGFEARVGCDAIALAARDEYPAETGGRSGEIRHAFNLYDRPDGRPIAALEPPLGIGLSVAVFEKRSNLIHVRASQSWRPPNDGMYMPYDLDGWVIETEVTDPTGLYGAVIPETKRTPSHVATAPFPLRATPDPAAAPVARMAPGAPFVAGPHRRGFVAIKIPDVDPPGHDQDFWLAETDLAAARVVAK